MILQERDDREGGNGDEEHAGEEAAANAPELRQRKAHYGIRVQWDERGATM